MMRSISRYRNRMFITKNEKIMFGDFSTPDFRKVGSLLYCHVTSPGDILGSFS